MARKKLRIGIAGVGVPMAPGDIHIGPSDYVPWLTDRFIAGEDVHVDDA